MSIYKITFHKYKNIGHVFVATESVNIKSSSKEVAEENFIKLHTDPGEIKVIRNTEQIG